MNKDVFRQKSAAKLGYHVYRSDDPDRHFLLWERITKTPVRDEKFTDRFKPDDDKMYYYKITEVDILGEN